MADVLLGPAEFLDRTAMQTSRPPDAFHFNAPTTGFVWTTLTVVEGAGKIVLSDHAPCPSEYFSKLLRRID
ncbi:hypothetical protein [Luteimonas fraxinea]|uniref:hypothetical protein n=1 Tax=Luteimonas fraxinea TaxID=2901869 RepID=UPI001E645D02|nr:hypothetical protein [Luteimonas fraxinea]MCD9126846.1 hypothetical protein [Luteimonas fraxinea]